MIICTMIVRVAYVCSTDLFT